MPLIEKNDDVGRREDDALETELDRQPCHAVAPDVNTAILGQLELHPGRPVRLGGGRHRRSGDIAERHRAPPCSPGVGARRERGLAPITLARMRTNADRRGSALMTASG